MDVSRFARARRQAPRGAASRRLMLAVAAAALATGTAPARAQGAAGYEYTFRVSSGDATPTTGQAWVSGPRMRVEMERRKKDGGTGGGAPQYLIVDRDANRMLVVNPEREEYSVTDPEAFEQVVGRVMREVDRFLTMRVNGARVRGTHVGPGEPVAGLPTERYRLVQQYQTEIGILGRTERTDHRVVTDYWMTTAVALPDNPFFGLLASSANALALHDLAFVRQTDDVRRAKMRGTPLRIAITARHDGKDDRDDDTMTIEITALRQAAVPEARFAVPSGYRQKADGMSFSF